MTNFEAYRLNLLRERLTSSVLLMGFPAYMAFAYVDYLYAPEHWTAFLLIRAMTCVFIGFISLSMRSKRFINLGLVVSGSHAVVLSFGISLTIMTIQTGGLHSFYYAGLNWVAIGSLAFWPSGKRDRAIMIGCIYGPLIGWEAAHGFQQFNIQSFLSLAFMAGTGGLSLVANIISYNALLKEFSLRSQLQGMVETKEKIIAVKSEEAANLKRLTKQFSPAVIEAIETQAISLDTRVRRRVAVIFMDVAGSTARSTSLDYNEYQRALDMFFDIAIKTLMARNITVANFMGDGLMAIANAPYELQQFEKVAFDACLEVLEEVKKRDRTFRELWREEFHIRIGISAGFANTGFFPNSDFGVYTAIGESVNLASRLCSSTPSSTIATTKNVIVSAGETLEKCNVSMGGSINAFKGFSAQDLEYFVVNLKEDAFSKNAGHICPLCNSEVREAADLGDCILLKCTSCTYSDIQTVIKSISPALGQRTNPVKRIAS